jgi:hypothetical protein
MAVTITDGESVVLTAVEADADQVSVPITDTLTWASDDDGKFVILTPSEDTLSVTVTHVKPPVAGTANITVTDPNGNLVSAPEAVTVEASAATTITIEAGTPEQAA